MANPRFTRTFSRSYFARDFPGYYRALFSLSPAPGTVTGKVRSASVTGDVRV